MTQPATALPAASLVYGARVHAAFTKWDGAPHWEYDLVLLGDDEHGVWVGGAPGCRIARPGREIVADVHWVTLYPHDAMWVATFNDSGGVFRAAVYVDVTTPASWWHRPDGTLAVDAVDLDLDVMRLFDGRVLLDDEDEFEEHRRAFGYPPEVVDGAQDAARWLLGALEADEDPFGDTARVWMDVCRRAVQLGEKGLRADTARRPGVGTVPDEDGSSSGPAWAGSETLTTPETGPAWGADDAHVVDVEHPEHDYPDGIDTSPVDPTEVTGLFLTTTVESASPLWFDGEPVDPEEAGVDEELADHLRDWLDGWRRDWDPVRGWLPRARISDYEALGRWLARRVKDAVGGVRVTLQLAHLGRSSLEEIDPADIRASIPVRLDADAPGELPVVGDFVTSSGVVGCFSSEVNVRLDAWAQAGGIDEIEASRLRDLMREELGGDYRVD